MTTNTELCGVLNCTRTMDLKVWQVPLCNQHWQECCARDNGCSIIWLRRNVRHDYKTLFDQYSMKTDKLFLFATRLELSSTELANKVRAMVPYTEEVTKDYDDALNEALTKVSKLEKWVKEMALKIGETMREIDAVLDAEFHRSAKQQAALRAQESNADIFYSRGMKEDKPRAVKKPVDSKPKFNLAAAMGKKPT